MSSRSTQVANADVVLGALHTVLKPRGFRSNARGGARPRDRTRRGPARSRTHAAGVLARVSARLTMSSAWFGHAALSSEADAVLVRRADRDPVVRVGAHERRQATVRRERADLDADVVDTHEARPAVVVSGGRPYRTVRARLAAGAVAIGDALDRPRVVGGAPGPASWGPLTQPSSSPQPTSSSAISKRGVGPS